MDDTRRGLPGQPIELAGGTHVFVDDYLIERTSALTRTAHQARTLPRPVLESGPGTRHTQVLFFPRVFHDPGDRAAPFRMWYDAGFTGSERRSYGYAESDDGLTWRFPELGIVDIAGSRANNVVRRGAYCMCLVDHARYRTVDGSTDPERRFVLLYTGGDRFSAAYSPDGFHWTDDPDNPVYLDTENRMEDRLNGCWDPLRNRYLVTAGYSGRPDDGFTGKPPFHRDGYRRLVAQTTSTDLRRWTPFRPIVVSDPEEEGPMREFYGMQPVVRGSLYLGFLRVLRDDLPADPGGPVHGIGWTELCTSRDGEHWTRQDGVLLDRGRRPGSWDHAMAWVGECVTVGDRELIYYSGYARGHKMGIWDGDRQLGVATLRRDGFVSYDAGAEAPGTLRTRPFVWNASRLTVNAQIRGELRVRLLDEAGLPVPGCFFRDCRPLIGAGVTQEVRWTGSPASLRGRVVRLEFRLRDAELYAITLIEPSP